MSSLYWKMRARLGYWLARYLLKWTWCVRQPSVWRWMEGQFSRLSAMGDKDAQSFYGHILLFRGQGFAAREEGLRLLRLAAAQGDGKAAFQLGVQALKGGVQQAPDALAASHYWQQAVAAGHPLAVIKLADLLQNGGPGLPADTQRAAELAAQFKVPSRA